MAVVTTEQQLSEQVKLLDEQNKQRLLAYARILAIPTPPLPRGTPGEEFAASAAAAGFTAQDLEEISRAIEEDCEQIDLDGWK